MKRFRVHIHIEDPDPLTTVIDHTYCANGFQVAALLFHIDPAEFEDYHTLLVHLLKDEAQL